MVLALEESVVIDVGQAGKKYRKLDGALGRKKVGVVEEAGYRSI